MSPGWGAKIPQVTQHGQKLKIKEKKKKTNYFKVHRNFPGGPVVRTQHFHCQGPGSIPAWGTKVSKDTILKSLKDEPKKECHESSMVFWFPMDHMGLSSGTLETLGQF